jgi:hypothetical protein
MGKTKVMIDGMMADWKCGFELIGAARPQKVYRSIKSKKGLLEVLGTLSGFPLAKFLSHDLVFLG